MRNLILIKNGSRWEVRDEQTNKLIFHYTLKAVALRKTLAALWETGGGVDVFTADGELEERRKIRDPASRPLGSKPPVK